ncbi:PEP-CTERM sorting domain-containing protein [Massilia sp. UYP11]|uniref:PEP-CTERM sorting domain-containing protein n=1 Tax=Massilia sp. UYP11 TaxID=1756385 RepID=UPI003D2163F5
MALWAERLDGIVHKSCVAGDYRCAQMPWSGGAQAGRDRRVDRLCSAVRPSSVRNRTLSTFRRYWPSGDVPEPATRALFALGLCTLAMRRPARRASIARETS